MKIKDIKHVETGETRIDGRYPLRIGSEVEFFDWKPTVGLVMILHYLKDNQGNHKDGYLRTSSVCNVHETESEFVVKTRNSIYYLEK